MLLKKLWNFMAKQTANKNKFSMLLETEKLFVKKV